MSRSDRRIRDRAAAVGSAAFSHTFLGILDTVAEYEGTSRAKIDAIRRGEIATSDEYIRIAKCLITMTSLVLNEGETK